MVKNPALYQSRKNSVKTNTVATVGTFRELLGTVTGYFN